MAPANPRQVLVWSLPTLAFLLTLLWYRRKRSPSLRSDPGGTPKHLASEAFEQNSECVLSKSVQSVCDAKIGTDLDDSSAIQIPADNTEVQSEKLCVKSAVEVDDSLSVVLREASFTQLENPGLLADKIDNAKELFSVEVKECVTSDIVGVIEEAFPENCSTSESRFTTACSTSLEEDITKEIAPVFLTKEKEAEITEKVEALIEKTVTEEQIDGGINFKDSDKATDHELAEDKASDELIVYKYITFMEVGSTVTGRTEASLNESDIMARKSSSESYVQGKGSSNIKEDDMSKKPAKVEETIAVVEDKLSNLQLGEVSTEPLSNAENFSRNSSNAANTDSQRAERDSANHSPADVMLASPSISSCSDAHSEGSSDSGKGCSDVATPPSRTPASGSSLAGDSTLPSIYEFVMPQHLVGRLIGRHGAFVHQIKEKTSASIIVKRHPDTNALKICAIEGNQPDIEAALNMIRQKFPQKRYPDVTLEQVCFVPPVPVFAVLPDYMQLQLIEDVNNDVILSSLVTPGHFFLQQPTHPTFPALNTLNACMNMCYSDSLAPPLPVPPEPGIICAAPTAGGWYRAQAVAVDPDTETCTIKFVDYGGYLSLDYTLLRQIRSDFMTLPFQAAECYLANVCPVGGIEAEWTKEAVAGMEELTRGQVLQAQVGGYAENGIPIVYIYAMHNSEVVLVNQELVNRGFAEKVEPVEA